MGLWERLRQLDDDPVSDAVVRGSDAFGWWWNLSVGGVLLLVGVVLLVADGPRNDAYACLAFGSAAVLVGLLLDLGRRRRD